MRAIHLRDKKSPRMAIHFDINIQEWQLTDDPSQVTCKRCRRIIERKKKA